MNRARSNLVQAKTTQPGVYLEDLCFQAQQAAEKVGEVPEPIREAARLTDYAVEARYPGVSEPVTEEEHREAVRLAEAVALWVESELASGSETPADKR